MSNYVIGKNAVSAVEHASMISGLLMPEIPVGDTYPSWDGEIIVYTSEDSRNKRAKDDIIGRVPVQVKGTHVNHFSKGTRPYNIEVTDLRNYSNEAGAFFLVVEMTDFYDVNKTKIFYAELLKYDIEKLIKGKEHQKTISHTFQELRKDKLYSLCRHFLFHRKEQGYKLMTLDGKTEYDEYTFTIIGNKKSDLDFYLFDSGTFIYGKNKHTNLKVPIDRFKADIKIEQEEFNIGTRDKVFYDKFYREKTKDNQKIKFGKSFTMVLSGNKLDINFAESGSIRERIKDCEFFVEIAKAGKIYLNHTEVSLNFEEDVYNNVLAPMPNYIKKLNEILWVLNYLGVEPNVDFDTLKKDLKQISFLIDVIINKNIEANKITDKHLQVVSVGNYKFILSKGVGEHENTFFDFFNYNEIKEKYRILISPDKTFKNSVEHSPYILLKPKELYKYSNLKLDSIEKDLTDVDYTNSIAQDISNEFLLNTLLYLDGNENNKRKEILTMIANTFDYIYEQTDETMFLINKMQAIFRKRKLTEEEIMKITEIKVTNIDDVTILCALDILLGNHNEFKYRFNKLSKKDKSLIKDYPIYNLIKNKIENQ